MDLLSPRPFWPMRDGLPATFPPLQDNTECDVAVIGGGLTGALVAAELAKEKLNVVVLDRRDVAHGSTAGNTGLMLYEIDEMLHRLARRLGLDAARRAFRRCGAAIDELERRVRHYKLECGFARKSSLYVATRSAHVPRLRREFEARRAAGLPVEWWNRSRIADESTLPHPAAILSEGAAQLDPYRLAYGLLNAAARGGARIYDRTVVKRWKFRRSGVDLFTSRGARVRARRVVVATGYEADTFMRRSFGELHCTFALITEPIAPEELAASWPANRAPIWDTADPYLYLRTTSDHRALIGGYDEAYRDPATRDRVLPAKVSALRRSFRRFFPKLPLEIATAWAGTFGITEDGLPFIGQHADVPHTWFALGFGGNGTTFAVIASEVIREAMRGEQDADADLFSLDRLR